MLNILRCDMFRAGADGGSMNRGKGDEVRRFTAAVFSAIFGGVGIAAIIVLAAAARQ